MTVSVLNYIFRISKVENLIEEFLLNAYTTLKSGIPYYLFVTRFSFTKKTKKTKKHRNKKTHNGTFYFSVFYFCPQKLN